MLTILIDMKRFITLTFLIISGLLVACEEQSAEVFSSQLQEVFPPVPIRNAALFRINNLPVTPPFFQGKWTIVALGEETCEQTCQSKLTAMTGIENVQKLYFAEGLADHNQLGELANKYADIAITSGTMAASVENFMRQFEIDFIETERNKDYLYLINPQAELEFVLSKENLERDMIQQEINQLMSREAS